MSFCVCPIPATAIFFSVVFFYFMYTFITFKESFSAIKSPGRWGAVVISTSCVYTGSGLDTLCVQGLQPASFLPRPEQGIWTITCAKLDAAQVSKLLWKKGTLITFWTVKMCFIWDETETQLLPSSPNGVTRDFCNNSTRTLQFFFQCRYSESWLTYEEEYTSWVSLILTPCSLIAYVSTMTPTN